MLFLLILCGFVIKLQKSNIAPKQPKFKRFSANFIIFVKNRAKEKVNKTKNLFKKTTKNKKTVDKGRVIYYNVIKDAGVYPIAATLRGKPN